MPKPTYDLIERRLLSSSTSSIVITIPQTHSHLEIVTNLVTDSASLVNNRMFLNGDTGSNYGNMRLVATNSNTVLSGNTASASSIILDNYSNAYSGGTIQHVIKLYDYKNTSYFKQVSVHAAELSASTNGIDIITATWRNTAAVTSITISPTSTNYISGSSVAVYGIREE